MKKSLSIIIIVIILLIAGITNVSATTKFDVALSTSAKTVKQGETVDLTVSLKNFTKGEVGINAMLLVIDYDKNVFNTLTTDDITVKGGWGGLAFNPTNGKMALDNAVFMAEDHDMLVIRFTAKASAKEGSTMITIKGVDASDGVNDIFPADQSIAVNVQNNSTLQNNVQDTPNSPDSTNNSNNVRNILIGTVAGIVVIAIIAGIAYVIVLKRKNIS